MVGGGPELITIKMREKELGEAKEQTLYDGCASFYLLLYEATRYGIDGNLKCV